jgi:hypothetical protein
MKRFLIIIALFFGTSFIGTAALTTPAYAASGDVLQNACKDVSGGGDSAACDSKQETISGTNGVLYRVTRLVAIIAGVAAVIVMIAGGLMFVTSNGDASKAGTARNTILYAAIGLVVIALAQAIVTLVVNRST